MESPNNPFLLYFHLIKIIKFSEYVDNFKNIKFAECRKYADYDKINQEYKNHTYRTEPIIILIKEV